MPTFSGTYFCGTDYCTCFLAYLGPHCRLPTRSGGISSSHDHRLFVKHQPFGPGGSNADTAIADEDGIDSADGGTPLEVAAAKASPAAFKPGEW